MGADIPEDRLHFDSIAELYDSVRPGYPDLLFQDIERISELPRPASVLDIGCGTGKSTLPLAQRGHHVVALDPGERMLTVCRRNLHDFSNVSFVRTFLENWDPGESRFDLVVSGTALHWVADETQQKISVILKDGGWIGVFWHTFLNGQEPVFAEFDQIYKEHSPENFAADFHATQEVFDRRREMQVLSLQGFQSWRVIRYYSSMALDPDSYVGLMRTWSTHRTARESLFDSIHEAIERNGGVLKKPIRTTLCLGQQASRKGLDGVRSSA
jgi:SAM-dependent methyltransferase